MPHPESNHSKPLENTLAQRLSELIDNPRDLATHLGCSAQAISQYKLGTAYPKTENLIKIAQFYNTSVDYLVGLSDVKSTNATIRAISEATGLSEKSLYVLFAHPHRMKWLNAFLESGDNFTVFMDALAEYRASVESATQFIETPVDEIPVYDTTMDVLLAKPNYMEYVRDLDLKAFTILDYVRIVLLSDFDKTRNKLLEHG